MSKEERIELPPLTQQPVQHVDGTPDLSYPVRILRAYRQECDSRWEVSGLDEAATPVYRMMNAHCLQRAIILDRAIAILEHNERSLDEAAQKALEVIDAA